MKKIVILIGLLNLNFVSVRCVDKQQKRLYGFCKDEWNYWRRCNVIKEKRKELVKNMFLFTYEEAKEVLKVFWSGYIFIGSVVAIFLTGIVLLGFTLFGLINSFDYRFNLRFIKTVGQLCKMLSVALFFECLLGGFSLKYFYERIDETEELLDGKDMEKIRIRDAYIREKILNDVDFDIYEYMFNNENK